jgi:hypothetical protein
MPPSKIRFVTACQQVLALAAVLAVLTPAASVVSLDVVRESPAQGVVRERSVDLTAHTTTQVRHRADQRVRQKARQKDGCCPLKGSGPSRAPRHTSR